MNADEHSWVEHDVNTGRPILVAPGRRGRPQKTAAGQDGAGECPFCPGAEQQTPPERDAVRPNGGAADGPGWTVRAFPNLYPAAPWHEVIAEGAEHIVQPGRVDAATWQACVRLWRRRLRDLESRAGVTCAFLFKNVGLFAGASIAHNHSQIIGLDALPPRLAAERDADRRHGPLVARELDGVHRDGRLVLESRHHVAFTPRQPRLPHELWLAARDDAAVSFDEAPHTDDLADALRRTCAAIDLALDAPAFNFWLHRIPGDEHFRWHFEFQPRTGFLAGLELGADAYINSISGAEAAARLRDAVPAD